MCNACKQKMAGIGRRKKAKKTMKRRRISGPGKGISATLTNTVLPITAGVVAGNYLPKILPASMGNYGSYISIGLGLFLAGQKGMVSNLGIGLAVGGSAAVVADLMDGTNGLGLLPPGVPSVRISGPESPYSEPVEAAAVKIQ